MDDALTLLKLRLLLQALDQVPDTELHATIIREADLTGRQAATLGFATLIFPCLFAERVVHLVHLEEERRRLYWQRMTGSAEPVAEVGPQNDESFMNAVKD